MVGGIAALTLANHERLKLRGDALEQPLATLEHSVGPVGRGPPARDRA